MNRSVPIFLLLMGFCMLRAQEITPWVVAGAGNEGSSGGYHLSWTLGEAVTASHVQADAALLQGFQQPNYLFDVLVREPESTYEIKFYPNPTTQLITIEIKGLEGPLTAEVFDLLGRQLFREPIEAPTAILDLRDLPGATYLFKIVNEKKECVGVWRVQKMRF